MQERQTGGETVLHPIARVRTEFSAKFGIPRQSGLVPALRGRVVFEPAYRVQEAFRELEGFSHLWLIWQFSEAAAEGWKPTVRPPRLGGNRRVGVFASRSPFRPNFLALSCVRLEALEFTPTEGPVLLVSGIDMLDGTPVYDVKPYLPLSDCHPEAREGFAAWTREHRLRVEFPAALLDKIPPEHREALLGVLEEDPRPGYAASPEKHYGLAFAGFDIGFSVREDLLTVERVCLLPA